MDLNNSLARLQGFELDELDDVVCSQEEWINEVKKKLKVEESDYLTHDKFNSSSINKVTLAGWLGSARDIMCQQAEMMAKQKEVIELLKTEALADKAAVIRLQADLLQCKDNQLQSLQAAVETTVQTTVKEEIKSYSAAVAKSSNAPVFSTNSLKQVVKSAMAEEDRGKNVMVFGLAEEEGEQIDEKIRGLFQELGEKPRVTASRVGRKSSGTANTECRPVKVTLASSTSVSQILTKTGRLKQVEQYKLVYVRPDLSPDERTSRKRLVINLKKAIGEQPDRHHYIKGGTVHSKDRT